MPNGLRAVRELSVSTPVQAPAGFALAFLNTYVRDLSDGPDDATLPLRYTLTQLAGLTLERDVKVRVEYRARADAAPADLNVAWEPDAGLFPSFSGSLSATATGEKTCTLTIGGAYDAPGGVAGALFDAVIGVRIAHGSLEQLIDQFRAAIETDYRRRMDDD